MGKYYTPDFKLEAVKRVQRTGEPVSKVAEELGINPNTLHGWMKRIREHPEGPWFRQCKSDNQGQPNFDHPGHSSAAAVLSCIWLLFLPSLSVSFSL